MDEPRDRLDYLILGHCTGTLGEAEEEELAGALQRAAELRRRLAWHLVVHRLLKVARSTRSSEVVVMATLPRAPGDTMARVMRELPLRPRRSRTAWVFAGGMTAAAAAALLLFA